MGLSVLWLLMPILSQVVLSRKFSVAPLLIKTVSSACLLRDQNGIFILITEIHHIYISFFSWETVLSLAVGIGHFKNPLLQVIQEATSFYLWSCYILQLQCHLLYYSLAGFRLLLKGQLFCCCCPPNHWLPLQLWLSLCGMKVPFLCPSACISPWPSTNNLWQNVLPFCSENISFPFAGSPFLPLIVSWSS